MAGQWVEDPRQPSGWRWDTRAPAADPHPTYILNAYAGGPPMARDDQATPRSVYDPSIGADGGGRYADPSPIPAIDPDNPVSHVDQLQADDGPEHWTGSDPAVAALAADPYRNAATRDMAVCCETCGTYVHPDRIRD